MKNQKWNLKKKKEKKKSVSCLLNSLNALSCYNSAVRDMFATAVVVAVVVVGPLTSQKEKSKDEGKKKRKKKAISFHLFSH